MNFKELNKLSTEELKVIALEKDKKGNATRQAFSAQKIIWDRAENPIYFANYGSNHKKRTSSDYNYLA